MAITITRGTTLPDSGAKADLHNLIDTATISGSTLDIAYDGGAAIAVDSGALTLNMSHATNIGLDINKTAGTGAAVDINNDGTGYGLFISQDGVLAANRYALYLYSNAVQLVGNDGVLLYMHMDNSSSTAYCEVITNDGTGTCLAIGQNGVLAAGVPAIKIYSNVAQIGDASYLLYIKQDNASSTNNTILFDNDGTGCGLLVWQSGVLAANKMGLQVYSSAAQTTGKSLLDVQMDNASSNKPLITITNAGSGHDIYDATHGAYLDAGKWTDFCGKARKENFQDIDEEEILTKTLTLPIKRYNMKGHSEKTFVSTFAEDFYDAFHIGSGNGIAGTDMASIVMVCVRRLADKLDKLDERIGKLEV